MTSSALALAVGDMPGNYSLQSLAINNKVRILSVEIKEWDFHTTFREGFLLRAG